MGQYDHLPDLVNPDIFNKNTKIKRYLTGSRIDNMKLLYNTIVDIYDSYNTDILESEFLFSEVMKKTKGFLNPHFVREELKKI